MTPQEKREWNKKIQAALVDVREVFRKHGCLISIDPIDGCLALSFTEDQDAIASLQVMAANRWRASVKPDILGPVEFEVCSSAIQELDNLKIRIDRLLKNISNPMEIVSIMQRLAQGERPETILDEYEDQPFTERDLFGDN